MVSPYERGGGRQPSTPLDTGWETQVKLLGQSFEDVLPVTDHGSLTGLSDDDHGAVYSLLGHTHAGGGGSGGSEIVSVLRGIDSAGHLLAINTTTYAGAFSFARFGVDFDVTPFTHFRIDGRGASNAAGEDIFFQLAEPATPATPLSAAGDDATIVSNTLQNFDSGWKAFASAQTGFKILVVAIRGETATVDLVWLYLNVLFKTES